MQETVDDRDEKQRAESGEEQTANDGLLRFDIEASSFCQQMVRAVVGTMVDVGTGKKRAGEMAGILRGAREAERAAEGSGR